MKTNRVSCVIIDNDFSVTFIRLNQNPYGIEYKERRPTKQSMLRLLVFLFTSEIEKEVNFYKTYLAFNFKV